MNLIAIAALIAVCGAAKLDRTYLPPPSAKTAGGSPGSLQAPLERNFNQGLASFPKGSYTNEDQGVVVDAAAAGTRNSNPEDSGLGAPRISYGSTNSKVGAAAFDAPLAGFRLPGSQEHGFDGDFPQVSFNQAQGSFGQDGAFQDQFNQGQSFNQDQSNFGQDQAFNQGQSLDQSQGFEQGQSFNQDQAINQGQSFNQNEAFEQDQASQIPQESRAERPQAAQERTASILRFENEVGPESFSYAFETDNGITAEESGVATNGVQAQGGFSYTGDDGQVYSITYTADENGYQPRGDHLPTPPPIPEEILKALEQNARDEAAGLNDDGSYDAQKYNTGNDYTETNNAGAHNEQTNFGRPESNTFIQNVQSGKPDDDGSFSQTFGNAGQKSTQATEQFGLSQELESAANTAAVASDNGFAPQPQNEAQQNAQYFGGFSAKNEYLPPNRFAQTNSAQGIPAQNKPELADNAQSNRFEQSEKPVQRRPVQLGRPQKLQSFPITPSNEEYNENSNNQLENLPQNVKSENPVASNGAFGRPTNARPNSFQGNSFNSNSNAFNQPSQAQASGQSFRPNEYLPPVNNFGQNIKPQQKFNAPLPNIGSQQHGQNNAPVSGIFQNREQSGLRNQRPQFAQTSASATSGFGASPQSSQQLSVKQNDRSQETLSSQSANAPSSLQNTIVVFAKQPATKQPDTELKTPFETSPSKSVDTDTKPSNETTSVAPTSLSQQPLNYRPEQSQFGIQSAIEASKTPVQPSSAAAFGSPVSASQPQPPSRSSIAQSQPNTTQAPQTQYNRASQFGNRSQGVFAQTRPEKKTEAPHSHAPNSGAQQPSQQPQGADDSYYYNQPSRPFNPQPQRPVSRFPNAPSNQFDRVTQRPSFGGQANFQNAPSFHAQNDRFPSNRSQRPGFTPVPTVSAQSVSSQGSTVFNGITQAAASSFTSVAPTFASQFAPKTQFPQRPSFQQATNNVTKQQLFAPQTFSKNQAGPQSSQFGQKVNSESSFQGRNQIAQKPETSSHIESQDNSSPVSSQQYNGEIYEYNKPAQTLPSDKEPSPVTSGQFGLKMPAQSRPQPVQQPTGPKSPAPQAPRRPQFESQPSRPFSSQPRPQSSQNLNNNRAPQSSPVSFARPQFGAQPVNAGNSPSAEYLAPQPSGQAPKLPSRPLFGNQNARPTQCCQSSLNTQFGQNQQDPNARPNEFTAQTQNQFDGQRGFIGAESSKPEQDSSSFAGRGEVFGGPRKPPSFDAETGYHY